MIHKLLHGFRIFQENYFLCLYSGSGDPIVRREPGKYPELKKGILGNTFISQKEFVFCPEFRSIIENHSIASMLRFLVHKSKRIVRPHERFMHIKKLKISCGQKLVLAYLKIANEKQC